DGGQAYYCHCTPEHLEQKREQARAENRKPKYDGTCREKGLGPAPGAAVRLKAPQSGVTRLDDLIKGPVIFQNEELDDLILARGDGMPTYHLAVVVDDITMDITHVIRGDDHVNNTPKQIQIYQALGQPLPHYAHVPMILGPDKTKLSKRHGAVSVLAYREMGILPEALINTLVRLGWAHGDEEIFSREEMIAKFSLDQVGKSAGIFNPEKLLWLNSHYLKESPDDKLAGLVAPFIKARGFPADDFSYLARVAGTLKTRSKTLVEMAEAADFYFQEELSYPPEAVQKYFTKEMRSTLELLIQRVTDLPVWDHSALESVFQGLVEQAGLKMKQIAPPIRLALTGKTASPGLFEVMDVLGKEGTVGRVRRAIQFIQGV
ncbi:MAG: glutamate--tRNA ligase, partial [Desulfobacteraceae bacterium]